MDQIICFGSINRTHKIKYLILVTSAFFILLASSPGLGQNNVEANTGVGVVRSHSHGLHGYIAFSADRPPKQSNYSYGMGFYSAVWPLITKPIAGFQIGLAGAWIYSGQFRQQG